MRYRLVVRLTPDDVGKRVVIRWRPGAVDGPMTDVLGMLEADDGQTFAVRTKDGRLVEIPHDRAVAGKVVPPPPAPRPRKSPAS
jgi:N-acetylglutamate synthase